MKKTLLALFLSFALVLLSCASTESPKTTSEKEKDVTAEEKETSSHGEKEPSTLGEKETATHEEKATETEEIEKGHPEEGHEHKYSETERVEPTCGKDGYTVQKCSCGSTVRIPIPKTGKHTVPKGGTFPKVCEVCGSIVSDPIETQIIFGS